MSFLDKVTKAVGDVVDKGKKDVDQFVRIQKINSEIRGIERTVADLQNQIEQAKQAAGEKAIELLRSGALVSPPLQPFVEQVQRFEGQISAERAAIAAKEADIARIKAEHEAEHGTATPPAPTATSVPPAAPVVPPPIPGTATEAKACAQCGAPLTGGAFCPQCGAKQTP
jgi:septal ring factor EnvC (AmiA/AmiB activator)